MKSTDQAHHTTACICSAPVGRFERHHIFTYAIATVKTSYTRETLLGIENTESCYSHYFGAHFCRQESTLRVQINCSYG